ncbi:Hsp20/alpha crystallin family protein [Sphaerochaeta sp. PS]|uniref:Hsp20/alpha crystallin family protein n=1 Tax=Sphaerochaeta sp. PS TaxID=3076336 RepID=UPI0028A47F78|nr:Hsp20/alpha crystallin family protein [Sphaerochaeta sp. PS]MDT4760901.1 Hsp20/alpha crystallin family protein [Sphaerochaeta sp. PS]
MAYLTTRSNYRTPMVSPFDSLFGNMLGDWGVTSRKVPPVDITETDTAYILEAELAGYKQEDVKVNIEKHVLRLSSTKESVREEKDEKKILICERRYQNFERSFSLPEDVNEEKIEGEFSNGVLTITLPKKEVAQPKSIDVKIKKN